MKTAINTLVSASLLAAAIVSVSADAVQAKKPDHAGGGKDKDTTEDATPSTTTSDSSSVSCEAAMGLMGADACAGPFSGNDTGSGSPLLTQLNDGLFSSFGNFTWDYASKIDVDGYQKEGDIDWDITFDGDPNDSNEGNGSIDPSEIEGAFAISLKSSTSYSVYFYESGSEASGKWSTLGTAAKNNQGKGLSHITLYRAQQASRNTAKVPEPGTAIAVVGAGLMLVSTRKKEA